MYKFVIFDEFTRIGGVGVIVSVFVGENFFDEFDVFVMCLCMEDVFVLYVSEMEKIVVKCVVDVVIVVMYMIDC